MTGAYSCVFVSLFYFKAFSLTGALYGLLSNAFSEYVSLLKPLKRGKCYIV